MIILSKILTLHREGRGACHENRPRTEFTFPIVILSEARSRRTCIFADKGSEFCEGTKNLSNPFPETVFVDVYSFSRVIPTEAIADQAIAEWRNPRILFSSAQSE